MLRTELPASHPRAPAPSQIDLVSHWVLAASPARVRAVLADVAAWPNWWPWVRRARPGLRWGPIGRQRLHLGLLPGAPLVLDLEPQGGPPQGPLRVVLRGALSGQGLWLLRADGSGTHVTQVWRLHQPGPRARWRVLCLRLVHAALMRAGGWGLARQLRRQPVNPGA